MANEIILYGTIWCAQTARARRFLDDCGALYRWCDIEQDPEACAFVERVNRGNQSVPTVVFPDGSILVEPTNAQIEKKIRPTR